MDRPQLPLRDKCGNKRGRREKPRNILKVKLLKPNSGSLSNKVTKKDKSPKSWVQETATSTTKTTVTRRGEAPDVCPDSDSAGADVFFFSESPTSKASSKKDKAMLSVLRTISKMLEENQLIRQKLAALSQAS